MSALWNDATCRVEESGVQPPQSKEKKPRALANARLKIFR